MADREAAVVAGLRQWGSTYFFQYWDDLVDVLFYFLQRQSKLLIGSWQNLLLMNATPQQRAQSATRMWLESLSNVTQLLSFPLEWVIRDQLSIPTLVFVADEVAESTAPQNTLAPIVTRGMTLHCTDLLGLGTREHISADHVRAKALDDGHRVQVQLAGLRPQPQTREEPLSPGQYVGILYAEQPPVRRPVVIVHAVIAKGPSMQPVMPPEEGAPDSARAGEGKEQGRARPPPPPVR